MVKPIPDSYPRVTPYLIVDDANAAIDFYVSVLGAEERMRMPGPDDKVGHAELSIGDSMIMLADEFPEMGARSPKSIGGSPVTIHVYVQDVDFTAALAVDAGATITATCGRQILLGIVAESSWIPTVTAGASPPTSRTSLPRKCSSAWERCQAEGQSVLRSQTPSLTSSNLTSSARQRSEDVLNDFGIVHLVFMRRAIGQGDHQPTTQQRNVRNVGPPNRVGGKELTPVRQKEMPLSLMTKSPRSFRRP